jgi:hypothetical protein
MLDEALGISATAHVYGPEASEVAGVRVVRAGFTIEAGGWSFDVVAVQAPDDPFATVYVTSAAD